MNKLCNLSLYDKDSDRNTKNNKSIFTSITEIADEEIIVYEKNNVNFDFDNDNEQIPSVVSINQLLGNYIYSSNFNNHLSIQSLLKHIFLCSSSSNGNSNSDNDNTLMNNIQIILNEVFLPNYNTKKSVSLL